MIDKCCICLEEEYDPGVLGPCGHDNICVDCAQEWFELQKSCPVCRATVTSLNGELLDKPPPVKKDKTSCDFCIRLIAKYLLVSTVLCISILFLISEKQGKIYTASGQLDISHDHHMLSTSTLEMRIPKEVIEQYDGYTFTITDTVGAPHTVALPPGTSFYGAQHTKIEFNGRRRSYVTLKFDAPDKFDWVSSRGIAKLIPDFA